jgi:hypothetical protein
MICASVPLRDVSKHLDSTLGFRAPAFLLLDPALATAGIDWSDLTDSVDIDLSDLGEPANSRRSWPHAA